MKKEHFKVKSLKISNGNLKEAVYQDEKYISHKVTPPKNKIIHEDLKDRVNDLHEYFHNCLNSSINSEDLEVKGFSIKKKEDDVEIINFTGVMFCKDARPIGVSTPGYDIKELVDINKKTEAHITDIIDNINIEVYEFLFGVKQSGQQELDINNNE
jgi:hypothetical protein